MLIQKIYGKLCVDGISAAFLKLSGRSCNVNTVSPKILMEHGDEPENLRSRPSFSLMSTEDV